MKTRTKIIASIIVAVMVNAFSVGMYVAEAQIKTGNLAQEVRRIADQDTDRFLTALEETVQEYEWKPGGKAEFWNLFKVKLNLDGYAPSAENVRLWERVREALKTEYNAGEVDTLLDGAISTLTPLSKGEGE